MKNKRGFLLGEETLKIIVAVICILLLIFLLVALYSVFMKGKKLKEAGETLNKIKEAMDKGEKQIIILKPSPDLTKYWWIVSWPDKENYLAETCIKNNWKNCLCICKTNLFNTGFSCSSSGVCTETPKIRYWEIPIRNIPVVLNIEKSGGEIIISRE